MQPLEFLNTTLTSTNVLDRQFMAKVFDLEELGWDFDGEAENAHTIEDKEESVLISVDEEGNTFVEYDNVKWESGDDTQTIKDLETLRGAHQLEEV